MLLGSSPTHTVSMEELIRMSAALENMALIHEIAINPDFVIEEKPCNALEKMVEECMKNAYWDKLRDDFAQQPPNYANALLLLRDIKKMVLDLLLPHHVRLRAEVESMLDLDLLKQQVENKCLDVQPLFENIIGLLRRLCAPSRDELLNNLLTKSDKVDMLRGICDVIEIMKVDMANFYVNSNRSVVEQHSIEYERMQFAKILQRNPGSCFFMDICLFVVIYLCTDGAGRSFTARSLSLSKLYGFIISFVFSKFLSRRNGFFFFFFSFWMLFLDY
ncbi:unnamed protein product [Gongylonema pulchrum]|uniref:T-complex protein 11-like protein 2 n=1 Tax=Gongylonema pulchrum TaxID=637853 RepID=A0A183E3H6_9BILA|nr:unnamed protein product [Gongylonema pulchrum]